MVAVPVGVTLFASLRFLLFFSVVSVALVLAVELTHGGWPALHKPHEISSCSLLQHPAMATRVATHVSLLLVVGLVVAPYQTHMLSLCSYFLWQAVVRSVAGEPLDRVAPDTKISLCVWIGFGGCAPVCRLGGAGEG